MEEIKIGYAVGNQQTLSGAVDKVSEKRMNKGFVTTPLEALSGQSAGVSISSGENRAAMLSSVRVRGTTSLTGGNDPLVIIDGVSADLSALNTIYPADIESFTILKDASETAQYGSRGASGVIEVATKKGKSESFRVSYTGNYGVQSVYKNLEMLSADEFRAVARQLNMDILDLGNQTNFPEEITRLGVMQNHHIAFGGGTNTTNYRASIGMMDRKEVVQNNAYQNFTAKVNLSQKAFQDRFQLDMGLFGSLQKNNYLTDEQKTFYSAATFNPTFPNHRNPETGSWDQITNASQITNPLAWLEVQDDESNAHFNTHMKFSLLLNRHLTFSVFGSYSYNVIENSQYLPTSVWAHGQAYKGENKTEDLLGNMMLSYTNTWGKHKLDVLGLAEVQKKILTGFYTTVTNFTTDQYGYNNLQAGAVRLWEGTGSFYESPRLASFLARFNYVYDGKYVLTANARADASSKVGENNRWGFFPSTSLAWILSEEGFLKEVSFLNNLKLRAGYGVSGNLGAIDSYNSLQLMKPNGVVSVNGAPTVTMGVIRNANPDLKWEVKRTFNVGLDAGFFQNRLILAADYYHAKTSDMLYLYDVSVPPFAYNKLLANLGSMENSGVELGLGITPLQKKDMELNINVNVAFQKNKLLSLSGMYNGQYMSAPQYTPIASLNGAGFHGGNNHIVYQIVGESLGVFYLPHCTGLVEQADGSYRYEVADLNGNGVNLEDGEDRYVAGQATPKAMLGSNFSFRYRNFDISLQINGAFGHKIYNGTALSYMNMGSFPDYNVMKGAPEQRIKDQTATDYWLENGDYVNFDYLTVGWNVPLGKLKKYIRYLRLSASVNNLATITAYSGLTPMINSSIVNSTLGVDDKRNYPVARSYSIGLNFQF
ncbi:SusC/RagA family TonB-linked outer membrane protein [Parabacteroides sp. AGMB00274]|uniref:SusC/RagA family TonB-linked outer membrane protein n=1 Tax=Parabacteroides faecalis TaxID=2924040 RepID=A0ABT0BXA1_9BACT|nr:SusC/RagA family TonB-linked outer membrane protein [Parabacteroides faecalis]MCI7286371.1 SusC/RagA family TonB-linked outer membrane protein [Parabacteroides sp.]MCJ2379188.1 SusC/RagA family TonB-linked outer membrane protein [Parabacteroides faecalis]MDY6255056.1 SusC/RagA family TonB-linked outer membrane protein [Bacteroidales bacterium]